MASNSSSVVISFSIAILLLLILLLLLSYNSKNKKENTEKFYNNTFQTSFTDPAGTFTNMIKSLTSNDDKDKFTDIHDPYAKVAINNFANMGGGGVEPNNLNVLNNFASLNGNEGNQNKFTNIDGFENQQISNDPTTCVKKDKLTSQDLLPKDAQNLKWMNINPSSQANIEDQNFLTAGYHIGVNTVGQSLRNANLQLRSEIPNPQVAVSPWLISTIEPDVRSTTLEIGSAPSY